MDERLIATTYPVVELDFTEVRLSRDWTYPGRCLLVSQEEYRDLQDMSADDYLLMMMEVRQVTQVLANLYGADKMNVASFGNVVAWLHWHIIPRHVGDAGWPATPWENPDPPVEADEETLVHHAERIEWAILDADLADEDDDDELDDDELDGDLA
jgi:diadenosine tetraphosphate (Ap4A) HIT family hydrolase